MSTLDSMPTIVTGAGRGIGRAIALQLASLGAPVALLARTAAEIQRVSADIGARGGLAVAIEADVTDTVSVAAAVARAREHFGPIRVLVNNAGTPGPYGPISVADPEEWWAAQRLHQYAPLLLMHHVIPGMKKAGGGRIINIVSSAATIPIAHLSAYAVGKAAATRLTETVDLEHRAAGVRAFALHPGTIVTDMARSTMASPDALRWIPDGIAMLQGRSPADSDADLARCTEVVAALASGRHDALGGRYLDVQWDLDTLDKLE
jgi:NAD(P)-dependent dehydrogenase (short-subunit alcohol dehydrogenase family)